MDKCHVEVIDRYVAQVQRFDDRSSSQKWIAVLLAIYVKIYLEQGIKGPCAIELQLGCQVAVLTSLKKITTADLLLFVAYLICFIFQNFTLSFLIQRLPQGGLQNHKKKSF